MRGHLHVIDQRGDDVSGSLMMGNGVSLEISF